MILEKALEILDRQISELGKPFEWRRIGEDIFWARNANKINSSLYSGVCGFLYVTIEAYQITNNAKYLNVINSAYHWLKNNIEGNNVPNSAFFTGHLGIVYTLIKAHKATDDAKFLKLCYALIKKCSAQNFKNKHTDIIIGKSGTLLALLHMYDYMGEQRILTSIEKLFFELIFATLPSSTGLYWERPPHQKDGLCGLSHGGSGIGWLMYEIGHYFNNENLFALGNAAFKHESQYYSSTDNNWYDLRLDGKIAEDLKSIKTYTNKWEYPLIAKITAWCHGAPGIGLARLRAYQISNDESLLPALNKAIEKTIDSLDFLEDYSLCHGISGNIVFLQEVNKRLESKYASQKIATAIDKIINTPYKNLNFDTFTNSRFSHFNIDKSLFIGQLGIVHFLFYQHLKKDYNSIIFPTIDQPKLHEHSSVLNSLSLHRIYELLSAQWYPKTNYFLFNSKQQSKSPASESVIKHKSLIDIVRYTTQLKIKKEKSDALLEVFSLEEEIHSVNGSTYNFTQLFRIDKVIENNLGEIKNINPLETLLILRPYTKLYTTEWDWQSKDWSKNAIEAPGKYYNIRCILSNKTLRLPLSWFSYTTFEFFNQPTTIENAIIKIAEIIDNHLGEKLRQDKIAIHKSIREQIIEGYKSGLLIKESLFRSVSF